MAQPPSLDGNIAQRHGAREPQAAPTAPDTPPLSHLSGASHPIASGQQPGPQPLPLSYTTSAGPSAAGGAAAVASLEGLAAQATSSAPSYSPASDPLLSFISSYLGAHPQASAASSQAQPATATAAATAARSSPAPEGSGGGSGGDGELGLWEVQWPELSILRLVGGGSFGSVYLAEWRQTRVAVKVLVSREDMNRGRLELPDKVVRGLQAEAAVMARMRHPNVVQFMGLVTLPPALITEYCPPGSLYDCLVAAREQPAAAAQLTWRRRLAMAVDAGTGLLYLHSRSIVHRDVKSPNLLLDESWRVKVADFNLSKLLEGAGGAPESSLTTGGGVTNPMWLAPEVMDGDRPTAASDVYSFGMVLYELLTWRLPWNFAEVSPFKVIAITRQGGRPELPPREALPGPDTAGWAGLDDYVQLMRDCWAQQPEGRPSFDEVVLRLRGLLARMRG